MRVTWVLVLLGLASGCGSGETQEAWRIELLDPAGSATFIPDTVVVLFEPGAEPRRSPAGLERGPAVRRGTLPSLRAGHYELWIPGCRPLRVDRAPTGPLRLEVGYPVDVTWRATAPVAPGRQVHVQATWRGAGDHPEAVLRTGFPAAARAPGERSWAFTSFVEGILLDRSARNGRFHVPWPGPYRITWGSSQYEIKEGPNSFSGSGGSSTSPGDGLAFEVSGTGPASTVSIPPR